MFNFLKKYKKTRLEKVSFDQYEGSLFSCLPCYLLSLLTSEILIIKRDRRKFPIQIQRMTLLLGGEKLSQGVCPGQRESYNEEARGHVSREGGRVCPREWVHLPFFLLSPRAHPLSSGAGSEQGQPRWWFCTQQRQQFAVEITCDSRIQDPCLFPPSIPKCSVPTSISIGSPW